MINKCINCCKWITCNNHIQENCEDFKFERIEIKNERKEKYEERKNGKKSN